jgi:hypothetical protein
MVRQAEPVCDDFSNFATGNLDNLIDRAREIAMQKRGTSEVQLLT